MQQHKSITIQYELHVHSIHANPCADANQRNLFANDVEAMADMGNSIMQTALIVMVMATIPLT